MAWHLQGKPRLFFTEILIELEFIPLTAPVDIAEPAALPHPAISVTCRRHIQLPINMPPSSSSKTAPSQPSQPSRKGKKAWRKNVDISTVQTGLENLREEIIQHGRPLAEKAPTDLFALDTVGSSKGDARPKKIKVLKMDEILGRRSAVPALENGKKRRLEEDDDKRVTDGLLVTKKQKTDWVSKKDVARLRNNLDKTSRLEVQDLDTEVSNFDIWDAPQTDNVDIQHKSVTEELSGQDEYIPKPKPKVAPPTLRRPPIALTQSGNATHAVPTPDAGQSYNPSFEDWDSLLTREGEKEISAERQRLNDAAVAAEKEARIAALAAQPEREPGDEGESEWEGFETEAEGENEVTEAEMKRRKRPERKTPAQRNKIKRRKEAERLAKHEARMAERAKRGEEVIKALISQHQQSTAESSLTATTSSSSEDPTALRRKVTLGPSRAVIPPAPLELVLPDELQDSLRRLKPEGNLLTDRFRNLLVNGKVEARRRVTYAASRKRQVKMTEKWWSKDFSVGV